MSETETTEEAPPVEVPTPEDAWEKVWAPILVKENGDLDLGMVKRLLFDYAGMLHDITLLFAYLTEGKIAHPQTSVHEVMEEADKVLATNTDQAIQTVLNELLDTLESFNTESAEVQLAAVIGFVNELYERGGEGVE